MKSIVALCAVALLSTIVPSYGEPVEKRQALSGAGITLFQDFFSGPHWDYAVPQGNYCVNLQNEALSKISSIETNGRCVILFNKRSCSGRGVRFQDYTYGYDDFGRVAFHDVTTSFKPC